MSDDPLKPVVTKYTKREGLLLTLLVSLAGLAANQLHQSDKNSSEDEMQHMRERAADANHHATERYEDLMRACGLPATPNR